MSAKKHDARSEVLFASAKPERVDRDLTLPARFLRLVDRLGIPGRALGKRVVIKMHLGGGMGYSTIHPFFVKLLVDKLKEGGARDIYVTDGDVAGASDRGYAENTVGARLVGIGGPGGKSFVEKRTGWKKLETVLVGREIAEADMLVNFSHVKGHGDCGFGGACKNLAMGCVPPSVRRSLHSLEGKLKWSRKKCIRCDKCIKECPTGANSFTSSGEYNIFWHNCKMCLHCMLACPTGAIKLHQQKFDLFQEGLARVAGTVTGLFDPSLVFHLNVLDNITIYCDCWGLTTPALVPDIGILGSSDIVAVDNASLKAIKVSNLIPGSITPPYKLGKGRHLFEKLHAKDPFAQVRAMERIGMGSTSYRLTEIK